MKQWPKDNKSLSSFEELTEPVVRAIRFAYKLERKNSNLDIPWLGYDIGEKEKGTSRSPDKKLSVEKLKYQEEEQGRSALETLIGLAVQLGIEQGRRLQKEDMYAKIFLFEHLKRLVREEHFEQAKDLVKVLEK